MSHSQALFQSAEIRAVEARCAESGINDLMQRAGLAAAESARRMLSDTAKSVLVLAGPGNNGGDAFEVACHLKSWFFRVTVFFAGDVSKLPADAQAAHRRWSDTGGTTVAVLPAPQSGGFDLVVDGLFGIGLARAPEQPYAGVIDAVNKLGAPILALDVPSGLNADTGIAHAAVIRATRTITFIARKPGLLTFDGPDCCGEIELASLNIPETLVTGSMGATVGTDLFAASLKPRPRNVHKGDMGSVAVLGGGAGMTGAALLAGRAALGLGAGRVYVGFADEHGAPTLDPLQPELMLRTGAAALARMFEDGFVDSVVVGPGLGAGAKAERLVEQALAAQVPIVLDADALNLIATDAATSARLAARKSPTLMTPHPGEAARLLNVTIAELQADRVATALKLAKKFRAVTLLKGAGSVIGLPDGRWFINTSGNPGMASAGMGDVLSGLLGTLLAQSWQPELAMLAGVHLHGAAADACVAAGQGPAGLTASEVSTAARTLFNTWCRGAG